MQPRSEPLLWLQCLALGAIPLELLLIRLVLAGADPGPVPGVERFLIWGVGVLAPAIALWRRPADWGSLLFVRQPLASRNSDQLRISASQGGLSSRAAVVIAAVILLPVLWWMDDSAVLASEFSPVSGQSRLVTLLLVSPLLALMVWQVQQLIQAAA
ncbi:MAG: low-complexity tail membrane protein, partial [Synechococcus sp. MOX_bin13]|nr:low-complexity tail membrane protein [Synechococcus sp. MOX_bin13]